MQLYDGYGNPVAAAGGSGDYADLQNKPKINGVELSGDQTAEALGFGSPSGEQVDAAVSGWLDAHPEATTTVTDRSVTPGKTDFLEHLTSDRIETTFSANGYRGFATDYIEIGELTHLYARVAIDGTPIGCTATWYDSAKTSLGSTTYSERFVGSETVRGRYDTENQTMVYVHELDLTAGKELGAAYVTLRFAQLDSSDAITIHRTGHSAWNNPDLLQFSGQYTPALKLSLANFADTGAVRYSNPNLIDNASFFNTGFNLNIDGFGDNQNVFCDYVDMTEKKSFYRRSVCTTTPNDKYVRFAVTCYDNEKNFLYNEIVNNPTNLMPAFLRGQAGVQMWDGTTRSMVVWRVTVPDEVAYVRIAATGAYHSELEHIKYCIVSYDDIFDLGANPETYEMTATEEFIRAVEATQGEKKTYTMVMIGDSLTNWGGGGDAQDGFLKIVHEKTGVLTANEALAGACWQLMDGETADGVGTNGVGRVNAILADQRKYDLYCFMLGTNAGSNTDTGETSADPSTMCGAIRYCMEKLKAYDPTGQILICLPPQRAEGNENQEKVNAVIKSIVESYGVRTLDIYHNGGIVPNTKIANVGYLPDGLHLGENGIQVLGNALAAEVKYLLCL